jgi:hypothetical protein
VMMESRVRGVLRIALAASILWELAAGIASGLHVSAPLRPGFANVLPIALDEALRSPLLQLGIPRASETAMMSGQHVDGVGGEYCLGSVDGSEDGSGL